MKKTITSALIAISVFCMATPINTGSSSKHISKPEEKKETAVSKQHPQQTDAKTSKKVKKEVDHTLWINNNGGGQTSYH